MDYENHERVLLIEDQPANAANLRDRLQDLGYEVTGIVSTGAEALSSLEQSPSDMVVLGRHFQTQPECVEITAVLESRFHIPVRLSGTLSDPEIQMDESFAPGLIGVLSTAQNSVQSATLLKERQKYFW